MKSEEKSVMRKSVGKNATTIVAKTVAKIAAKTGVQTGVKAPAVRHRRFASNATKIAEATSGSVATISGNAYVWEPGRYESERHGMRWREPRWDVRDGIYVRADGGWINEGPNAAPPMLREERWEARHGFVYIRGHWDWGGGQYNWVPGHYERERVGHVWREPRWEQRDGVYISVGGVWE